MTDFSKINSPKDIDVLISFADLSYFSRTAHNLSNQEVFRLLQDFYELTGSIIEKAGGYVVNFCGDEAIIIFPTEKVNEGVMALKTLKKKVDADARKKDFPCRAIQDPKRTSESS